MSLFANFGEKLEPEDNNIDNFDKAPIEQLSDDDADESYIPYIISSPTASSTRKSQCSSRSAKNLSMMSDLIFVVEEIAYAIKNLTYQIETLYTMVIQVESSNEKELVDVFDYLQLRKSKAVRFTTQNIVLIKNQIEEFLSGWIESISTIHAYLLASMY